MTCEWSTLQHFSFRRSFIIGRPQTAHIADPRTETRHVSAGAAGLNKEATPVTDQNAPFKASFWDRARAKTERHIQPQRRPPSYAHVTRSQYKAVCTYCQNCGEDNHLTGQYKHWRTIECFHCGKLGHKNKLCSLYWNQGQKDWPSPISRASTFNLILKDIGAANVYDVNVLESIVNSGDIWSYCDITKSPADGHCILHSLITSTKNNSWTVQNLTLIIYCLQWNLSCLSMLMFMRQMSKITMLGYCTKGLKCTHLWNNMILFLEISYPLYYVMLWMLICMIIIDDSRGIIKAEFIKSAKRGRATNKLIFLYKRGEHYNAISPKSPHALWQFGRAQIKEKGEVSSPTPPPTSTNDGDDTIEDFLRFL